MEKDDMSEAKSSLLKPSVGLGHFTNIHKEVSDLILFGQPMPSAGTLKE